MARCLPLTSLTFFFFFNDTATTEIYTLSLHDALPISRRGGGLLLHRAERASSGRAPGHGAGHGDRDRKSTRLNSSHSQISYAVFCLKKKKNNSVLPDSGCTTSVPSIATNTQHLLTLTP